MGYNLSKEEKEPSNNIAIAQVQAVSGQVETKLNYLGIVLIIISVILGVLFCYAVRTKCRRAAKRWLRRAVADLPPPTIKTEPPTPVY